MTWLTWWQLPDSPFPCHADHPTEEDAHAHALRVSRETGCEVAVVEVERDAV